MKKSYLKYIAGLLLFGSNGVVASFISLNSSQIVLLRSFFGSLMLLGIFLITRMQLTVFRFPKDFLFIALSGAAMAADWLLLFEAYERIGVSLGMLINYSGPVIVMFLSPLIFRERLTRRKCLALAAALGGVFLISGEALSGGSDAIGLLCAVLSAFSYAGMVICNKKSEKIIGMENALLQLVSACVVIALFVGFRQGFAIKIVSAEWPAILWLGIVNTGIGCFLYFSAIGKLSAQSVSVCGYLEPLSAVVLSALILHEKMGILQCLGMVLIIAGAAYGEGVFRRKPAASRL